MNRISTFRAVMVVLVPMVAMAAAPRWRNRRHRQPHRPQPAACPPRRQPHARPGARRPAAGAPPRRTESPADPPATAPSPSAPAACASVQTADPFGEDFTLAPKNVVIMKGTANWDAAFDTIIGSFKALTALPTSRASSRQAIRCRLHLDRRHRLYVPGRNSGRQEPKNLAKNMSMGKSPEGKALKFAHRGSYDNMDNTYEAITNHLDDKKLEAKDTFIEEYVTDPLKTPEDKLVINVYVPLK